MQAQYRSTPLDGENTESSRPSSNSKTRQRRRQSTKANWRGIWASEKTGTLLIKSNPEDDAKVKEWEHAAFKMLATGSLAQRRASTNVLFDVSSYYENIGQAAKAIYCINQLLLLADKESDVLLMRRAHNVLGALYARVCDFKLSFIHSELAYKLALEIKDAVKTLASLSNAAVTLYSAGLIVEARDVALKATCIFSKDSVSRYLQFINSNNGTKFCNIIGDIENADRFYELSVRYYNQEGIAFTGVTKAYHQASTADYFISKGRIGEAVNILRDAIAETNDFGNIRILAILNCAISKAYAAAGDSAQIIKCERVLCDLLPKTKLLPFHHQEILEALVRTSRLGCGSECTNKHIRFVEMLREFLLVTRHGQFFDAVVRKFNNDPSFTLNLQSPGNSMPKWLASLIDCQDDENKCTVEPLLGESSIRYASDEALLRSKQYMVAEDWAVAAEFFVGGNWRHCFGVGELARIIALELGFKPLDAAAIGMGARLRDIGKIATAESRGAGSQAIMLNEFGKRVRHSEVGEALLGSSSDVAIQMGFKIAGCHNEWWNGCGVPRGLREEEIPIEARICSVADEFLGLVELPGGSDKSVSGAIRQISCMAGVQLDPTIVGALLRVLGAGFGNESLASENFKGAIMNNGLILAKKNLFEVLELAE